MRRGSACVLLARPRGVGSTSTPIAPTAPARWLATRSGGWQNRRRAAKPLQVVPNSEPGTPFTGTIQLETITFTNKETGFTIARAVVDDESQSKVVITGQVHGAKAGMMLDVSRAEWISHDDYGRQVKVSECRPARPVSSDSIAVYLAKRVAGVGPATAAKIIEMFGGETLEVLKSSPARLAQVKGITLKKALAMGEHWAKESSNQDSALQLTDLGVPFHAQERLIDMYGEQCAHVCATTPYLLAQEVFGVGFATADRIAERAGMSHDEPARISAALTQAASEGSNVDGHTFLLEHELLKRTMAMLLQGRANVPNDWAPDFDLDSADIVRGGADGERIYSRRMHAAETVAAKATAALLSAPTAALSHALENAIARVPEAAELGEEQLQALRMALVEPISVISGGPGVGKTFVLRTVVRVLEELGSEIELAAPTGRAAMRLGEVTDRKARTIHRLLEYLPHTGQFARNRLNPIEADVVLIDEASMLDVSISASLLSSMIGQAEGVPRRRIVLVGDVDQLPSVGPGRVLRDLISAQVPTVFLKRIFRQAEGSAIVRTAHVINSGSFPEGEMMRVAPQRDGAVPPEQMLAAVSNSDCVWADVSSIAEARSVMHELLTRTLPQMGVNVTKEVQVLCPGKKSGIGAVALNDFLRPLLNPCIDEALNTEQQTGSAGGGLRGLWGVGDRVIQTSNNYDKDTFNGDIGSVVSDTGAGSAGGRRVVVNFNGSLQDYKGSELIQLAPAWAITVHKAQGSEYPIVIIPCFMEHYMLLTRKLFYTGVTRARQLVVLVGSRRALSMAVKTDREDNRNSALAERICALVAQAQVSPAAAENSVEAGEVAAVGEAGEVVAEQADWRERRAAMLAVVEAVPAPAPAASAAAEPETSAVAKLLADRHDAPAVVKKKAAESDARKAMLASLDPFA